MLTGHHCGHSAPETKLFAIMVHPEHTRPISQILITTDCLIGGGHWDDSFDDLRAGVTAQPRLVPIALFGVLHALGGARSLGCGLGTPPPVSWGWYSLWFGFVLSVMLTLLAMATLVPSTRRGMKKGRVIRRRNAIIALEYNGEVVGKSPSAADTGARYGGVGPHIDVTIRREDGSLVTASLPILFDSRFPIGSHVVKRSGLLWPDAAYGLKQDPDDDRSG